MSDYQQLINLVESKKEYFAKLNDKVWSTPETGFAEHKSAQALTDALTEQQFKVETHLAGIPTAFKGVWGKGKPVIAFLGEFDALPSLSQKAACAVKSPVEEKGNGHGCGHCSLGAGSMAAATAVKEYMQQHSLEGTVVFFGCPAEESGCGKTFMAREGVFDDVDIALTWHPDTTNHILSLSTLANIIVEFHFKGTTSHAAASPHLGRSALDAAELMNVGVNYLREHIVPEARVHYAYRDVGGGAPNVVQDRAVVLYYIRAPKTQQVLEIFPRVVKCAEGAAHMTETQVEVKIKTALSDYIPNSVVSSVMGETMAEIPPQFSPDAYHLAKEMQKSLSETELGAAREALYRLMPKDAAAEALEKGLATAVVPYSKSDECMAGSTDVGDVSHLVPTAQLMAAAAAVGTPFHSWQMTAQAGSIIAHEGINYAAKVLAVTAAKLLCSPDLVEKAKAELYSTTGGVYRCPIPADVKPSV